MNLLKMRRPLLVALLCVFFPIQASGTLVVLIPTRDGLIVAADRRGISASASLGVTRICDDEPKLIELTNVERTVVAFVGVRRLFFPRAILRAEDFCTQIKQVPVGLDVRNVVREHLDHNGNAINRSAIKALAEHFVTKLQSPDLSSQLPPHAGKSLFGITVGSYDTSARKSLMGSFGIELTKQAKPFIKNLEWEEVDQGISRGALVKGDVGYFREKVVNGIGQKYLREFSSIVRQGRLVRDISAKEGMAAATNLIDATIKTTEALKDSNTVGGNIDVVLVGDDPKPVRLKWKE